MMMMIYVLNIPYLMISKTHRCIRRLGVEDVPQFQQGKSRKCFSETKY